MKIKNWNIKKRMMVGSVSMLLGITIIIGILFFQTRIRMETEHLKRIHNSLTNVTNNVEALVREVYTVSDSFVGNVQLNEFMERKYDGEDGEAQKKGDTIRLYNQIISSADFLEKRQKISAIYTEKDVLFNFKDANMDGEDVVRRLKDMNISGKDHLMRFYWYPLQDNFMVSRPYKDIRKDKVVIGARRVYSFIKEEYVCTHIFCVQEQSFYDAYKENFTETEGDIYVMDSDGNLISSSNEDVLAKGEVNRSLKWNILNREKDTFAWDRMQVCVTESDLNGWLIAAVIPEKSITGDIDKLYQRIFLIVTLCMLFGCAMLFYLYRTFINPVNELNSAMREVYSGNMNAYIEETGKYEIGDMMHYFNTMLESINVHIVEKLETDRKKQELELEVLMGQINPHFLYNTLENIVWKSSEAGHPDIGRMAASLGRMYRLSISDGQIIVSLQQEIEHLMAYVKIQKNRYDDAFELDLRTNREEGRKYYVLKILLQPVVENSFLYGMEGIEHQMIIRVSIEPHRDKMRIRVMDNGAGMDRETLKKVREQIKEGRKDKENASAEKNHRSTGIGLHNVAERIRLYFGLEEPVKIYSKKGIGTLTVIEIPLLTSDDIKQNEEKNEKI